MKTMNSKSNARNGIILVFVIVMITQFFLVLAQDSTPPKYSLNSTNSTGAGKPIEFRLNWTDDVGLSGYIFSFDNCTGTLTNYTWTSMTGTGNWSNVTKTVNETVGCTIRWCVYANDTSNNWNGTSCDEPFNFVTSAELTDCSVLDQAGATYYLTADIIDSTADKCMNISVNDIVLDCQGHTIDGTDASSASGIYVYRDSSTDTNITVKNCVLTDWGYGAYLRYSNNNTITNSIANSNNLGIHLWSSSNNQITNSTANNNNHGISLSSSSNNQITNSTANNNTYGIRLFLSSNNQITNSTANNNTYGIYLFISDNNIITGGSISSTTYDYYLRSAGTVNNFTNTNFTAERKIYFYDTTSWFNYNNVSVDGIWLKTKVSTQATINRTLINWNQSLMQWNDSASGVTARYNLTELKQNTKYNVYDNGTLIYPILETDSEGRLNFTIDISDEHEIKVEEALIAFHWMNLTPSSEADIDPNVQINITAKVTDEAGEVDTVIFQYKQDSVVTWTNDTMDYNSATGFYENASFTPTLPGTWNYRIWLNDTLGNTYIYNQTNLSVQYEYTWRRSPANFGVVSGIITTTSDVGVLTINNTGDYPLNFDLSSNWGNIFYNVTEPFDLAAKGVKVINITATFAGATREDDITITIDATSANADPSELTTNATLASYAGGPYFDVSIVTYSAAVAQSQSGISLSSKLRNIGNETATNTWLNWTLPSGWTNTSGNLTQNISNLTVGSTAWNNLTVTIDPETAYATTGTITVTASCAENITDSSSESVTVICNSTDGVCGLGCTGTTDNDCQVATTTPSEGGAGGGRSGDITLTPKQREKLFQTQETYELVRGREQNFTLKVENQLDGVLEDVEVSISGFLAQYLRVEPKLVERIAINRSFDFTIWIEAPKYFTRGEHYLNFTITGRVNKTRIIENITKTTITYMKESRLVTLIIYEVSREEAESYLNESVKLIEEMKEYELNTEEVETLLSKARDNFNNKNYEEVKIFYESIKQKKEEAFETLSLLEDLKKMLKEAEYKGLEVPKTGRLILLSKAALDRGDYKLALKRADDARTTYALETLGKFNFRAFIGNNWSTVSLAIIGLSIGSWFAILSIRFYFIKEKIKELKEEEGILLGLIKEVQKECFEEGKLSMKEYMETLIQYEKRLSQVIQETIKLETKETYLFKPFKKENKRLLEERKKLLNLIKETQRLYLEARKLETRIYENRMRSYAERLAEIEETLATLEAKKVVKKSKFNILVNKMKSIFR